MTIVYLSLGTNLGDRLSYLKEALEGLAKLPLTSVTAVSPIYETEAWGNTNQPDFLNLVCQLETGLPAHDLLKHCQAIELDLGRERHEHWGPRTIDIDILLYGRQSIQTVELTVPHPYMMERGFVLVPLANLTERLELPGKILDLASYLTDWDTSDVVFYASSDSLWEKSACSDMTDVKM